MGFSFSSFVWAGICLYVFPQGVAKGMFAHASADIWIWAVVISWKESKAAYFACQLCRLLFDFVSPAQVCALRGEAGKQASNNLKLFVTKVACSETSVSLLHEKVRLYLQRLAPYLQMFFFPCHAIVFALWPSVTAALAAWGMRKMKNSEQVNPNSPKVWTKGPNQGARMRRPVGHDSPAEEECGHQQQMFPTVVA